MNNYQEKLQNYISDIEGFLTSVLLEETNITITAYEEVEGEAYLGSMDKSDIYLYTRDEELGMDFISILDQEWFGLLSSIMLGVEEKKLNEVTKDLLLKFSSDLKKELLPKLQGEGITPSLQEVEVLTLTQLGKELKHTEYALCKLEVEGLADDNVRASVLFGNPEALIKAEEPEEAEEETQETEAVEKKEEQPTGTPTEVISGRYIEFEEFDDTPELTNENGKSMDLLKDVEMDVAVELGRIKLPLGKVLQLAKGSVIELEKLAGEPVDILVNGQRIAHGEVVVIDEHFGVRISNLITTKQRIAQLQ
jgi:flagellar motor switch protein FliN